MIIRFLMFQTFLIWSCGANEEYFPPLIPYKSQQLFKFTNKVTLKETSHGSNEENNYTFSTLLQINSVWSKNNNQLLQVYFQDNRVSTISKSGRQRLQDIVKIPDRPFYITLIGNVPTEVVAHTSKDQWLLNMERAVASLLLFQYRVGPTIENDVSGMCNVFYNAKSVHYVEKRKKDCSNWDLKMSIREEPPLDIFKRSVENLVFEMSPEGALLKVTSLETHKLYLAAQPEVGSLVESSIVMEHVASTGQYVEQFQFETLPDAIASLLEWYRVFEIEGDVDGSISDTKGQSLKEHVDRYAKQLTDDKVGHAELAEAFARLLRLAHFATTEEFKSILQSHKDIHSQLVDLMGAAQTIEAHKAINETFSYKERSDMDILEKYLQSLAVANHPDEEIVADLFDLLQTIDDEPHNKKIKESITHCLASLAQHFMGKAKQIDIREYFVKNLKKGCEKDVECKLRMIRALQNMRDPKTIDVLIGYAFRGEPRLSVAAMQALRRFAVTYFRDSHRMVFTYIFYQMRKKYDTSARTLALDILLEMRPSKEDIDHLVEYLASNDRHFEIKTYVIQRLKLYADKYPKFRAFVQMCMSEKPHVNNYHTIAQRGFSSVLARDLSTAPAFNETLLSVQEIYKGVLKRGSVELIMNANNHETSTFKLGIFTNGLETFVSNSDDQEEEDDDDDDQEYYPLTAGMEISVNGIIHRPLIFFTGKAELMTHIWSGTVSESTPAFQATMKVHNHEQYVILASGATAFLSVLGAKTIDLNGKAGFSLWNRNAQTEIKQNSAFAVYGLMKVGFTYATLAHEFVFSYEPKIVLQAHIDFYDQMKLCMRLQRPEMILSRSNTKSVTLDSTHKLRKTVRVKYSNKFPAHTFALNQKNNDMCRIVSNDLQE